jgi:hypothetical protein
MHKEIDVAMNRKERRVLARKIARLEEECKNEDNISEKMAQMEELLVDCSLEDLLRIDEMLMKKFLTN